MGESGRDGSGMGYLKDQNTAADAYLESRRDSVVLERVPLSAESCNDLAPVVRMETVTVDVEALVDPILD